jgi:hypothetical protein
MNNNVTRAQLSTETMNPTRRRIFGAAAMTIAAAQLGVIASASAQTDKASSSKVSASKSSTHTSFKSLKQINAGLAECRIRRRWARRWLPPCMLLHGWPYDIHSFVDVAPLLGVQGLSR